MIKRPDNPSDSAPGVTRCTSYACRASVPRVGDKLVVRCGDKSVVDDVYDENVLVTRCDKVVDDVCVRRM